MIDGNVASVVVADVTIRVDKTSTSGAGRVRRSSPVGIAVDDAVDEVTIRPHDPRNDEVDVARAPVRRS